MNQNLRQPEPSDAQLEALLAQALAAQNTPGGVPADLAQRIYDLTRDQELLDALLAPAQAAQDLVPSVLAATQQPLLETALDESLAPHALAGGVPVDLAQRVFAATAGQLRPQQGVLAKIGPRRVLALRHLAAGIVFFLELSVLGTMISISNDANRLNLVQRDLQMLAQYEVPNTSLDRELALLQASLLQSGEPQSVGRSVNQALNELDRGLQSDATF